MFLNKKPGWQRITLQIILAYEAVGCILGGVILIADPGGQVMNMPVDIMHSTFHDFLIPGFVLLGLGLLNAIALFACFYKVRLEWIWIGLAIGGLTIWFIVEIAIIKETHWLQFMWGFPVIIAALVALPLFPVRQETIRTSLLLCGILSSSLYIIADIISVILYKGYKPWSQTVSELSAIDAPTRPLWLLFMTVYAVLMIGFAWGIWISASRNKTIRKIASLFFIYSIIGFFWPPMHQREELAIAGRTFTDTLHIVFTIITVLLMMLAIGFGSKAFGNKFQNYSIGTIIVLIGLGVLTGLYTPAVEANRPTPGLGFLERINIGAFLIWVVMLAYFLIRHKPLSVNKENFEF